MNKTINPVLQDWVMTLNWKEQTGLISAIRGVDISDNEVLEKECKSITRMIRFLVLNNADSKTTFMTDEVLAPSDIVNKLEYLYDQISLGNLPLHWSSHIFGALKIIIEKHPNKYIRLYWHTAKDTYKTNILNKLKKEENPHDSKKVEESNLTMDDIKNIVSEIDNNEIGYPAPTVEEVDYPTIDDKKPIVLNPDIKLEPVEESVLDTKDEYPIIVGKDPLVSDNIDREDYSIYNLEFERFINVKDVSYNCINTPKTTQKQFKDMIEVIPQLDAILTNNWDIVNDTMSADYNLSIPISKGLEMCIKESDTNRFMIADLTGELLYKDHLDQVWIIDSLLVSEDILKVTVVRYIRDAVVYLLNPYKMSIKEDNYIHGELEQRCNND